jgi:HEPN domain-containing protein
MSLKIAHRQLAMAEALLEKGLYEGAVFHCYHALEAICLAGIANRGQRVPLPHRAKLNQFRRLYPEMPFTEEFASLVAELYPKRERSLYADIEYDEVSDPTLEYTGEDAEDTVARTRSMVGEIERLLEG